MPVVTHLAALLGRRLDDRTKAALAPDALVKLIVSRDRLPDPPRIHPKGYIHVSSLVRGDCPRAMSLQRRFNAFSATNVNGATRIMWKLGRAAEVHVRTQLIASLPASQVFGQWKCPCGKREREGLGSDDNKCNRCGFPATEYVELDLADDTNYVTGHPDFILILDGQFFPVEIKSLGNSKSANERKEGFDSIVKPFTNHVLQVSCYHKMLDPVAKRLGMPMGASALILYVSKDFNGFKSPFPYKEYHVNPFAHKPIIQAMFKDARASYLGVNGTPPPRLNACSSAGTKCALACNMAVRCFALPSDPSIQ